MEKLSNKLIHSSFRQRLYNQSLIDWLICLVTAWWGPHEYQGLENIRGRARITTTKEQKNTKTKQQQKSKNLWMIKMVCGAYLSYWVIPVCVHRELRKKLIQQRPRKQDGVLGTLLNLMEGCYLCNAGGALLDMKDLEACKPASQRANTIKRVRGYERRTKKTEEFVWVTPR